MKKMKWSVFLLLAVVAVGLLAACSPRAFQPRNGDLLFCVADASAMSGAIVDATQTADSLQFDHVAVFALLEGEACVIEATSQGGVVCRSWQDFVGSARRGYVVMRVAEGADVDEAVERARSFVGQPYDWSFLPHNGKLYCSELVYESYLKRDGTPLFAARPMNFRRSDGEMPAFWTELFRRLGEPIPEGVPGTNPNDMAREPVLRRVKVVR